MERYAIVAALALALAALVFAWRWRRSSSTPEKFTLPAIKKFTQVPVDKTYKFATPLPGDASAFDKQLHSFTDARVPAGVLAEEGEPEPTPYTDAEVESVAMRALKRAAKAVRLQYVSTEFATKRANSVGGTMYDIAFLAYDPLKNFATKLALVALVAKNGTMYIKEFRSFNRPDRGDGPTGTDRFGGEDGTFVEDLGLNYVTLYG
jgi:membrane protein implicated in regulation of membrane protease activity